MAKLKPAQCFQDPSLYCSSVLLLLFDSFGPDMINWEPETIYASIKTETGVDVDPLTADKINAVLGLLSSNLYHRSLPAFCALNSVFNFKYADPDEFRGCTLDDILWGTTESRMIEGPEDFDQEAFTHDIARYTAELLSVEGVTKPPSALKFAEFPDTEIDERECRHGR